MAKLIDVKKDGLMVRYLPGSKREMELLEDHVVFNRVIPKGFVFDGATLIDEDNDVKFAALLHDYFYRTVLKQVDRSKADKLFHDAMIDLGVSKTKAKLIYAGVRVGGLGAWKDGHK